MLGRRRIAMLVAEFIGVATLIMALYTIVLKTSFPLFAGLAAGSVVGFFTLIVGPVSGAHLNPAITIGLWTVRKIQTLKAIMYIAAQLAGAFAAGYLLKYFIGQDLQNVAGDEFTWKVFIAELIGAAVFGFGVASAVFQKYEGGKLAAVVGGSLFIGVLLASLGSNSLLNPAVAFGINSWSWAYAAAPVAGAFLGMNIFSLLFASSVSPAVAAQALAPVSEETPVRRASAASTTKTAKKKATSRRKKTTTRKSA